MKYFFVYPNHSPVKASLTLHEDGDVDIMARAFQMIADDRGNCNAIEHVMIFSIEGVCAPRYVAEVQLEGNLVISRRPLPRYD